MLDFQVDSQLLPQFLLKFRCSVLVTEIYISRWGWSFLSDYLLIFYNSNAIKNTPLGLLHVNVAFEGYNWPWINHFFNGSKLRDIS